MIVTTNESHRLSPAEASQFLLEMAGCVSRYLAERAVEPAAHSPSSAARIHDVLLHIGVPPHICGFRYLTEAVHQALLDSSCLERVTLNLYPKVAGFFMCLFPRFSAAFAMPSPWLGSAKSTAPWKPSLAAALSAPMTSPPITN